MKRTIRIGVVIAILGSVPFVASNAPVGAADCNYTSDPTTGTGATITASTLTTTREETVVEPTQVVEQFRTRVLGVDGSQILFDETVDEPSTSGAVATATDEASTAIAVTGRTPTAPYVVESTRTLMVSNTVLGAPVFDRQEVVITLRETMGGLVDGVPASVFIGTELCYQYFVPGGVNNIDVLTTTELVYTVTSMTTETYLTSEVIAVNALTVNPSFTG